MIHHANILEWAASYDGPLYHACFCDAPYEMAFMGREWDSSGVAFDPETWRLIARCLHPGAFLFVFAGTINDDLISVAMRKAGLRKHHKALAWVNGSGMKKGMRADAQIDKAAGAARPVVGQRKHAPKFDAKGFGYRQKDNGFNSKDRETFDVTAPASELSATWEGHSYGLQTLKPCVETLLVFQKDYEGSAIESIVRTGAGTLNIGAGRIGTAAEKGWPVSRSYAPGQLQPGHNGAMQAVAVATEGRWPSNVLLTHHPDCTDTCVDGCGVKAIGEQSGESRSKASQRGAVNLGALGGIVEGTAHNYDNGAERGHNDSGNASRYFFNGDYVLDRLEAVDPMLYCPKASAAERDYGLEDFDPITVDDGRKTPIDNAILRGEALRRNPHPTLKPLSLVRYLAGLLLPPDAYAPRRLLVPFAGVASEYIGAMLAG